MFLKRKREALRSLSREESSLLVQAWLALLVIDLLLRVFPFEQARQVLVALFSSFGQGDDRSLPRIAHLVDLAARHHIRPVRCLQRALVLQCLLSRHGLSTDLKIGIHKRSGNLHAHAWLEAAGIPFAENPQVRLHFMPLLRLQKIP
jgi:hypothetical protein